MTHAPGSDSNPFAQVPCINLIPAARRHARQRRARTKIWVTVGTVYASLVMLVVVFTRVLWVFDNRSLAGQLAGLKSEIDSSESAAKTLHQELRQARALWETRNVVADQPDWSLLLAILSQSITQTADGGAVDVVLRGCELKPIEPGEVKAAGDARNAGASANPDPSNAAAAPAGSTTTAAAPSGDSKSAAAGFALSLNGLGQSQAAVTQFVLRLEKAGLFDQVRLLETRREPFIDAEVVGFKIQCIIQ